ncbi:MAG: hypothetical protein JW861_08680 [Bacteroidales bacterium]|nr:hypothetical protein [Bacteroidales bacterium]
MKDQINATSGKNAVTRPQKLLLATVLWFCLLVLLFLMPMILRGQRSGQLTPSEYQTDGRYCIELWRSSDSSVYHGHDRTGRDHFWINVGMGVSSYGMAGGFSLSWQHKWHLFSFRGVSNEEVSIFGPDPNESAGDFALVYGPVLKTKSGSLSVSTGISLVKGRERGELISHPSWFEAEYELNSWQTFGFPFECDVFWTPLSFMGLGINGFANINNRQPYIGGLVSLQFGRLR